MGCEIDLGGLLGGKSFEEFSLSDLEQRSNMKDALKKQKMKMKIFGIITKGILTKHKTIDLW